MTFLSKMRIKKPESITTRSKMIVDSGAVFNPSKHNDRKGLNLSTGSKAQRHTPVNNDG